MIAYDALRYLWQEVGGPQLSRSLPVGDDGRPVPPSEIDLQQPVLAAMQRSLSTDRAVSARDFTMLQRGVGRTAPAWHPLKIIDLVTLGSPLACAELLMADGAADLVRRHHDREYATLLPTAGRRA